MSWYKLFNEKLNEIVSHGEIVAGSPKEKAIVDYLKSEFEELGLDVELQVVPVLNWSDEGVFLEVITSKGNSFTIPAVALPYSPPMYVEADLVYGGTGLKGELENIDVEGKIVLLEWFKEELDDVDHQYFLAVKKGAIGVIVYDAYPGYLLRRIVVSFARDYRFSYASPPPIPIVSISREDGLLLKKLIESGYLKATLEVNTKVNTDSRGYNVIATIEGKSEEEVIIGAHHDRWFEGAADNAVGIVILLLLAKIIRDRDLPLRTLKFISFTAEESGAPGFSPWYWIHGSRYYLRKRFEKGELDNIYAFLSTDVLGRKRLILSIAGYELQSLLENIASSFSVEYEFITSYSDCFSFSMYGIPALCIHTIPHYMKYYHTNRDIPENIDPNIVNNAFNILLRAIRTLAYEHTPLNYLSYLNYIEHRLLKIDHKLLNNLFIKFKKLILKETDENKIRIAFSILNTLLYLPCLEGFYDDTFKPFTTLFLPQLEIWKDISLLKDAIACVKRGEFNKAKEMLSKIPPTRIVPGYEVRLPSINTKSLLKMIDVLRNRKPILEQALETYLYIAQMELHQGIRWVSEIIKHAIKRLSEEKPKREDPYVLFFSTYASSRSY